MASDDRRGSGTCPLAAQGRAHSRTRQNHCAADFDALGRLRKSISPVGTSPTSTHPSARDGLTRHARNALSRQPSQVLEAPVARRLPDDLMYRESSIISRRQFMIRAQVIGHKPSTAL